jgi:hypothetical protein
MADTIKLTVDELGELRSIQTSYQEKTYSFGQLYIDKLNIDEKQKEVDSAEVKLRQELLDVQQREQQWMAKISEKYGEGNLSLKDGTFTKTVK